MDKQLEEKKRQYLRDKISNAIREEESAISGYTHDAKIVDSKTAKLLRHIAKDERHHKTELNNRLKQLR